MSSKYTLTFIQGCIPNKTIKQIKAKLLKIKHSSTLAVQEMMIA
jgi:hypothetical protein